MMRVYVRYQVDGEDAIVSLKEVDYLPRIGEKIAFTDIDGTLEVVNVIHAFSPDYGDHLITLETKFIPSANKSSRAFTEFYKR